MIGTVPGKGGSDDLLDEQTALSSPGPATNRALGLLPPHKYDDRQPVTLSDWVLASREELLALVREEVV